GVALGLDNKVSLLRSYLTAFLYVLAIGLGALWFVAINHLTNAKWSIVVRRVAEIVAAQMPVIALLSLGIILPIALADTSHGDSPIQGLYAWLDEARVHSDHILHHKSGYLNKGFFLVRYVVYFGVWVGLSWLFFKKSTDQDKASSSESEEIRGLLARVSAPAMIAFALTLTFCAFDLLMSLDYTWFSTIFGVYYFAGCVINSLSWMVLALRWVQSHGRLSSYVNENHYHDLGKLMFAFTIFWAYIGFSQYMLIWYGDIPEETAWYKMRLTGDWWMMTAILPVSNFIIPFFGLLSRHVKRNPTLLSIWAVYLVCARYYDLYWLIWPTSGQETISFGAVDVLVLVGVLGVFFGMAARRAKGVTLVPVKDSRLPQSLAFENY
ncbi:MAG TPA: hypothetical protein VHM70_23890, partial [Polyangiaceae bacterium]|nr:hypothetical protein [Polyangiaceae bacterium]